MKKILILHTGGTISMAEDENGHVSPNAVNPMNAVSMQFDEVNLVTEDIFNLPSPHVTLSDMLVLKNRIKQLLLLRILMEWSLHMELTHLKKQLFS